MRGAVISVATVTVALMLTIPGHAGEKSYRALAWRYISQSFPPATRSQAYRVAYCETAGFTDFLNNGSGAADLFQEMPGNNGRVFTYEGRSLRLNYWRLTRRDSGPPTLYAARIAYLQSRGGYSWSEWSCQP